MAIRCECCGKVRKLEKKAGRWMCKQCIGHYERTGELV